MKIHVVLCSHNGEKYIEEQINSILCQEHQVDFIHIYDFSSQDRTLDIIQSIKNKKIILNSALPAHGAASSFFFAFNDIIGKIFDKDLVFFADQDDVWLNEKTKHVIQCFLIKHDYENLLLAHDVKIVDSILKVISPSFYTGDPYLIPRDLDSKRLLLCNPLIGHTMAMSGALLKKICKNINSQNYLMHDWAISLFCYRYAEIEFLPQKLSLYRQHDTNIIGAKRKNSIYSKIKRTYSFSGLLIGQAEQFGKDIQRIDKTLSADQNNYQALKSVVNASSKKWRLPLLLAWYSASTGPTMKRKLLSIFILFRLKIIIR